MVKVDLIVEDELLYNAFDEAANKQDRNLIHPC